MENTKILPKTTALLLAAESIGRTTTSISSVLHVKNFSLKNIFNTMKTGKKFK
jgi:hypothetical protein